MSKELHISPDLSLPIDAATQTFAFIARKGAGKTFAAGKLVEQLMDAGVQCVILDTVGNWYGLRLAADGKAKGFDVPVFGGLRKDLPLEAGGGDLVADVVVDTGRSVIVDLSQFSLGDRKRFATTFGERLWRRKKGEHHPSPLMLVIEESQLIVPQFSGRGGDDARMIGIYEEIIRLGRNYGIGCTMISQRPQSVNKEVLNQTECLFVGQVNGAQERKALKEWITHQGMDVHLVDELPGLAVGTMYVWSPQWLQILKKVKIGAKKTYDASATPKVGQKTVRREPAPLDVNDIEQKMAAVVERAKAEDPRLLKVELAKANAELAKAQSAKPTASPAKERRVEIPVLKDGQLDRLDTMLSKLMTGYAKAAELSAKAQAMCDALAAAVKLAKQPVASGMRVAPPAPGPVHRPKSSPTIPRSTGGSAGGNGDLPTLTGKSGLRRILIALAQRPGLTNNQIGVRAGLSSKSGTFDTYLSKARTSGWISDQGGRRFITDAGLAALGDYEPLPEGRELLDHWLRELGSSGAGRILRALVEVYPGELNNDDLAAAAGMTRSGTFDTYMSKLRTLELIQSPQKGVSKASDEFFQ